MIKKPEQIVRTVSLNNRFAVAIPDGWHDNTVFQLDGPIEDGIKHGVNITSEHGVSLSLEQYGQLKADMLAQGLQGYHERKRGLVKQANGRQVYELIYDWSPVEEREIIQKMVVLLQGGTAYTLMASFSQRSIKTFGPMVDKIAESFTPVEYV